MSEQTIEIHQCNTSPAIDLSVTLNFNTDTILMTIKKYILEYYLIYFFQFEIIVIFLVSPRKSKVSLKFSTTLSIFRNRRFIHLAN